MYCPFVIMKLPLLAILCAILASAGSFAPIPHVARLYFTQLHMGLFDLKPFHGGGSGEDKNALDEQWDTQQAILRERRGHIDKEHLKQKYAAKSKEIDSKPTRKTKVVSKKSANDDAHNQKKPRFFWEK
jgi:hypothetical protein